MQPPVPLGTRFGEALRLAHELHARQVRKGSGVPYVAHLLGTASLALEHGADEDEAIAALLHDAVEDQGGAAARERIRAAFGDRVTAIVDGCTDSEVTPKPPWRARKEAYLAHVAAAPPSVRLVSACDKLHNARAIVADLRVLGEALWPRFSGGREGTLWYYRGLLSAFRAGGIADPPAPPSALIDELERAVLEMERLAAAG